MTALENGCELCAGPPEPGHNFCEGCGRDLHAATPAEAADAAGAAEQPPAEVGAGVGAEVGAELGQAAAGRELWAEAETGPRWRSSRAPAGACASCGATEIDPDGYCENCGRRRLVGPDDVELELAGVAGVTHKGQRKQRNEDALAIGQIDKVTVAVLCDGVSSSARADEAAHAGVDTGIAALLASLDESGQAEPATVAGARAAAAAVAALVTPDTAHSPPSCTYVSAVVTATELIIGWVGDSRAYWLGDAAEESVCLTTDDADPDAGALVRWLGADADDLEAQVATFTPAGPGRVLLCSDGLSRYLSEPAELAVTAPGTPAETARALNQLSLDAGGVDNIAIVIMPFPPQESS
jgi:serine/threonine protein phosphatase PrpC